MRKKNENFEYKPNTVIADGADAIKNGFDEAFPELFERRVMCFAHVIRKIDAKLKSFVTPMQKHVKFQIRRDIKLLQLCESEKIFDVALKLFLGKWRSINSVLVNNFLSYFEKEWTTRLKGWFEGYAPGIPSTNNGIESWNNVIKLEATLRQRHSMGVFLSIAENDIVRLWSKERTLDAPIYYEFKNEFQVNLPLNTAAFQWTSSIKTESVIKMKHGERKYHFSSSNLKKTLTREKVVDYLNLKDNL